MKDLSNAEADPDQVDQVNNEEDGLAFDSPRHVSKNGWTEQDQGEFDLKKPPLPKNS